MIKKLVREIEGFYSGQCNIGLRTFALIFFFLLKLLFMFKEVLNGDELNITILVKIL